MVRFLFTLKITIIIIQKKISIGLKGVMFSMNIICIARLSWIFSV